MHNQFSLGPTEKKWGLNKYNLLQTMSLDITSIYQEVFKRTEGSLTTVVDNDAISKFKVAINELGPDNIQCGILSKFEEAFGNIENEIDPERLLFTITKAGDGEICINRKSKLGLSKIIINEDGVIAHSFIAYENIAKNILAFDNYFNEPDYQNITFRFLSF